MQWNTIDHCTDLVCERDDLICSFLLPLLVFFLLSWRNFLILRLILRLAPHAVPQAINSVAQCVMTRLLLRHHVVVTVFGR